LPAKIPALGCSAVPLPMKIRTRLAIGPAPVAEAFGDRTTTPAGSPLETVAAAGAAAPARPPNSRRATANPAHANGAAGPFEPSPPARAPNPNQPNNVEPITGTGAACAVEATGAPSATPTPAAEATAAARRPPTTGPDSPGTTALAAAGTTTAMPDDRGTRDESGFGTAGTFTADASAGASLFVVAAAGRDVPRRAPDGESALSEPAAARTGPRAVRGAPEAGPPASLLAPPTDPDDPVSSAKATGAHPTDAPIPNATANAPTRPTYRAQPDPNTPGNRPTEGRPIGRTEEEDGEDADEDIGRFLRQQRGPHVQASRVNRDR
jgi:hypothetical protein